MQKTYEINETKKISKALGGTLSLTVSTVIVKLLGLIYKIPLAGLLGDEGMGFFNSAYTVYTFFFLLCTAGVPKAVMILVSESRARNDQEEENKTVRVALKLFLWLWIIITAIFMLLSHPLSVLIGNSRAAATMLCIAPSILIVSLGGVVRGYLSGRLKFLEVAVSQIIEGVGRLVFGLVFAIIGTRMGYSVHIVSAMTILGVSIGAFLGLLYMLICTKMQILDNKTRQNVKLIDNKQKIRRILSISLPITISASIMSMTNMIDLGLIMRSLIFIGYTEEEAGALYGNYTTLAVPMFNLALALITPISVACLPLFTEGYIKADTIKTEETERTCLKLSTMICAPLTLGLIVFSREILTLLFPSNRIDIGAPLLCFLAVAIPFSSLLLMVNTMLEASGKVKAPLVSMLFGSAVKIIVSFILIRNPLFGISGAPIGTVMSYVVALICSLVMYSVAFKKGINIISPAIPSYVFAALSVAMSRLLFERLCKMISENLSLTISIAFAGVIYLILTLSFELLSVIKTKKRQNIQISKFKIIQ